MLEGSHHAAPRLQLRGPRSGRPRDCRGRATSTHSEAVVARRGSGPAPQGPHRGAVLAEWSASQAEVYAGLAEYTAELERDARRIAAEAREKGNARLELQAIAASRAHVELVAKLATASQQLEPEERLAR